jgi:hypothetical protein
VSFCITVVILISYYNSITIVKNREKEGDKMLVESELEGSADAIVALYNKCLRCHRRIKAPQVYGPTCAKKVLTPEKQRDSADAAGGEISHCGAEISTPLGRTD